MTRKNVRLSAVLWPSCLAMLAIGANSTAIMAALPEIRAQLALGPGGVEWAVNAYLVVSAAFIVLGGEAADRFGALRAALAGLVLFAIASCVIATASSEYALLGGRALQGFAAAFAVPSTLTAVDRAAAPERRTGAISAWSGFLMLGFSVGPLIGGALTQFTGWRAIFWLNIPLMLVAAGGLLIAGAAREGAGERRSAKRRLDWTGFVLLAVLMVSIVFTLHALPEATTQPLAFFGPLGIAAMSLVLLLVVERRVASPLVDLDFFRRRKFVLGIVKGTLAMFSIMGLLLYFNLYAQSRDGLSMTALQAGATLLQLSAGLLALALSSSQIAAKIGLRNAMTLGMALIVIASAIVGVTLQANVMLLGAGFVVMGAGLALPYALAPRLALSALAPEQTGQGAGIVNACTFVGGSAGVAVGSAVYGLGGFPAVVGMIAAAGVLGVALSRGIPD